MAFNAIQEYDANVAANNTDIGGVNVNEGCAPSGINNAIRELAKQIRRAVANQGVDISSAASVDLGGAAGQFVRVTGTTTITSLGTVNAGTTRIVEFTGSLILTHNATSLILPGAANIVTASGDIAVFVSLGGGNWKCEIYSRASGKSLRTLPKGYIFGLTLSNNAVDAANDIDIAAGAACDEADLADLNLSGALTKRLDASWAVGSGGGGLDTGTKAANAWYHVWLIRRPDTGIVDALYSLSATAPTMPANYTQRRRLGAVRTDASGNIRAFSQVGDQFLWNVPVQDASSVTWNTTASLITLTVPTGVKVHAIVDTYSFNSSVTYLLFTSPDQVDTLPSVNLFHGATSNGTPQHIARYLIRTNTSAQMRARASGSATGNYVHTNGWVDRRGQDA